MEEWNMHISPKDMEERKKKLKMAVEKLHQGVDVAEVKEEFKEILKEASPLEISKTKEELVEEGVPLAQIQNLWILHLDFFKKSLAEPNPELPETHPIFILIQEHKIILNTAIKLAELAQDCSEQPDQAPTPDVIGGIMKSIEILKDSANHYHREENVLFPKLESRGIVQPPAIMWTEHDIVRGIEKTLFELFDNGPRFDAESLKVLRSSAIELTEILSSHFYKENNILFQTSLRLFSEDEWKVMRADFDDIGYGIFHPEGVGSQETQSIPVSADDSDDMVRFESGALRRDILERVLNTLPVDITFVDEKDHVRYFSLSPERIFVRAKSVIGREVRNCHRQKSVDRVEQILDDFLAGTRDNADFWINLGGQLIYIRYFAVRDDDEIYLGCLEVSQNLTEIKKIEGEKRLLD
ncbi:DUF438 domain-containing protein [Candidatus Thorarchaeota archaeon]|nr:MAG: DUF438 domain-containing protein [Candidatus Thorarchaeota archaeon]